MKAITLWEPWATAVALELKPIETRTHGRFCGLWHQRIAIHAAKALTQTYLSRALMDIRPFLTGDQWGLLPKTVDQYHLGCVLCTAWVADTGRLRGEHSEKALCECAGRYGLFLQQVSRLAVPAPAVGRQGIWDWNSPTRIPNEED